MADITMIVSTNMTGLYGNTEKGKNYLREHPYMVIDSDRADEVAATIRADGVTVEVQR